MKCISFSCSVRGPAHQQDNVPNQDAAFSRGMRKGHIAAVCDGLGSRAFSDKGAQNAVAILHAVLKMHQSCKLSPLTLSQKLQQLWIESYKGMHSPFETTCLWAWCDAQGQLKAAQAGDGLLLIRCNGQFRVLTAERDSFSNQTITLAQAKEHDWVVIQSNFTQEGDGVILITDGISDDLLAEQLEGFFDAIFQKIKRYNKRRCKSWLQKELNGWQTPKHADDKSIAAIFRIN